MTQIRQYACNLCRCVLRNDGDHQLAEGMAFVFCFAPPGGRPVEANLAEDAATAEIHLCPACCKVVSYIAKNWITP